MSITCIVIAHVHVCVHETYISSYMYAYKAIAFTAPTLKLFMHVYTHGPNYQHT